MDSAPVDSVSQVDDSMDASVAVVWSRLDRLALLLSQSIPPLIEEVRDAVGMDLEATTISEDDLRSTLEAWLAVSAIGQFPAGLKATLEAEQASERVIDAIRAATPDRPRGRNLGVAALLNACGDALRQQNLMARLAMIAESAVSQVYLGALHGSDAEQGHGTSEIAGIRPRIMANLLDTVVVLVVLVLFYGMLQGLGWDPEALDRLPYSLLTPFLASLILAIFLARTSSTIGKRTMGLVVAPADGGKLGLWAVFKREFPGRLINNVFLGIGYLMAIPNAKKQTWGDQLAGTVVVRAKSHAPMRVLAPIIAYGSLVMVFFMIPQIADFENPSEQLRIAITEGEPSVVAVLDSVKFLAERPVGDDSLLFVRDLEGVVELAQSHEAQLGRIREQTQEWLWKSRWLAPYKVAQASRVDSLSMKINSCIASSRILAEHSLRANRLSGAAADTASRAAAFAASDMQADYAHVLVLMDRLDWGKR